MPGTGETAGRAERRRAVLALGAAGALWGTTFLVGKQLLEAMGVGHMLVYRFVAASAVLLLLLPRRPVRPGRRDAVALLLAGVLGVPVQYIIQFEGLARTSVSHASLMIATMPVLLALAGTRLAGERLGRSGWLALVASTGGAAMIAAAAGAGDGSEAATLGGDLLVCLSVVAGVAWVLYSKRLMERLPVAVATAYVTLAGTVALVLWVLGRDGMPPTDLPWRTWLALLALGCAMTALPILLWNWGIARVPASQAGVFLNLEPVVGTMLGVLVLRERLSLSTLAGGAIILVASNVVARQEPA